MGACFPLPWRPDDTLQSHRRLEKDIKLSLISPMFTFAVPVTRYITSRQIVGD